MFKFGQFRKRIGFFIESRRNIFYLRRGSARNIVTIFIVFCFTTLALFLSLIYPRRPIANILLYHSISTQAGSNDSNVIDKNLFVRQLKYLTDNGYETVLLSTVVQEHKTGKKIPAQRVVLTFDDGRKDFYDQVYPVLREHGLKATLFISPGRLEPSDEFCTWAQLKEMKNSGLVEIGAHGLYHYQHLTCLPPAEAEYRLTRSKAILEEKLGGKVSLMAYPYGAFNYQVRELAKKVGYEAAVGTVYPRGKFKIGDIYNMRRVYVSEISRYPFMFRFMLSGYYVPTRALVLRLLGINVPRDICDLIAWTNSVLWNGVTAKVCNCM